MPLLTCIVQCTICFFTTGKKRAMQGVGLAWSCIHVFCRRLTLPQHLYKEHRASWRWVKNLYGDPPRPISYYVNRRTVPDQPSTGPPDVRLPLLGCMGTQTNNSLGQTGARIWRRRTASI